MSEAPASSTPSNVKPITVIDRRGQDKPVDYRNGNLKRRIKEGKWKAHGQRLLVRAILRQDYSEIGTVNEDEAFQIEYDPKNADAWEVIDVGAGCAKYYEDQKVPDEGRVVVGDHVMHRSVVADRCDINDQKCRYWWLHVEDVLGVDHNPRES